MNISKFTIGKFVFDLEYENRNYKMENKINSILMQLSQLAEECRMVGNLNINVRGQGKKETSSRG